MKNQKPNNWPSRGSPDRMVLSYALHDKAGKFRAALFLCCEKKHAKRGSSSGAVPFPLCLFWGFEFLGLARAHSFFHSTPSMFELRQAHLVLTRQHGERRKMHQKKDSPTQFSILRWVPCGQQQVRPNMAPGFKWKELPMAILRSLGTLRPHRPQGSGQGPAGAALEN